MQQIPYPQSSKQIKVTRILNIVSFVVVIVFNVLGGLDGVLGGTTGDISDSYPTLITPAGYAFSVWGLIYFFIAAFCINQLRPSTYSSDLLNKNVGYFFILSCMLNVLWIIVWHLEVGQMIPSAIFITSIWLSLLKIYISFPKVTETYLDYITIVLPFSFYTAWLTAASTVNWYVVAFATTGNVPGVPASIAGLVVVGVVALCLLVYRLDPAYAGVISWALIAIYRRDEGVNDAQIGLSALTLAIIIAVVGAFIWIWNFKNLLTADKKKGFLKV